jgi:predicted ATPase
VTFLLTDVEGSTRLLHELGAAAYAEVLEEHRRILRDAFAGRRGVEVDTQGDAFFFAFPSAPDAVAAAGEGLERLAPGPVRVRVGIHTGTPHLGAEGYVGHDVHKAARIAAAAHGGQVVVSDVTRALVDGDFLDLGEHRLKDFGEPVPLFQLGSERFPPLKTISNTNLPRPASSFVGREREVAEVTSLLRDGTRLLTLTGPGGSGKTRLALESAAELVGELKAGVFWVGLAPLRDPALVTATIAETLGAKDDLAAHVGERELLLLLDNLEQVAAAAPELATVVESCPNLRLLVTSRELLRVRAEREYPVPPLADGDAVELFCARAGSEPSESVAALSRALDNLPLALELAAARTRALSVEQIVERLSERLDLLEGGRDAEPRQRTLRATIEWSHDLLEADEKRHFARLSVFIGGATLGAARDVAGTDVRVLQSLVEKSLLRRTGERFWLLETIREYAAERLAELGELDELRGAHARHFEELARRLEAELRAGEPEEGPVAVLEAEIDNLRAAAGHGLETGDVDLVRAITVALSMYWIVRGRYPEGRAWLERALGLTDAEDDTRRRLLSALGTIAYAQGDHKAAVAASDGAAALAAELGDATHRLDLLREQALAALRRGDLEAAERRFRERLELAAAVDNGVAVSSCRLNLASIANQAERYDVADALLAENLPFVRSKGQARCEAHTLSALAESVARYRERPQDCLADARLAATRALQIGDNPLAVFCLDLVAAAAAARGDIRRAATILAATEAARKAMGVAADEDEEAIRAPALALVGGSGADAEAAWAEGRALGLEAAVELATSVEPAVAAPVE